MKFPVLITDNSKPKKRPVCPQCGKNKVFEPHSMAVFAGGALFMDRKRQNGSSHDQMNGFASIVWHGAHDGSVGQDREIYAKVDCAQNCRGGQFEIYFCSTNCLRAFFNSWVDALETKIHKEKRSKKL